jgi:hypothetical protein
MLLLYGELLSPVAKMDPYAIERACAGASGMIR